MNTEKQQKKSEVALREEEILRFWQEHDIFNKSLKKEAPKGDYVFYDGPPFATGLPHVGSLLSSIIKDVVGRYWTMKGYHVERRWGWDCHGLPIENLIENELGLKDKKAILDLGVDKFNEACRAAVLRYADDWKEYVSRVGRWVDYDGAYKTMDNSYMESVWWFLSEMHKKELLYEGRKVLLYCPHCETPLSKAEIAMDNSYKDVTEESVYVKFKVTNPEKLGLEGDVYLVAWTTTPWTLPGNVALAVHEEVKYSLVNADTKLIVATDLLEKVFGEETPKETKKFTGQDLIGLTYDSLFEIPKVAEAKKEKTHSVLPADFVTTEDGTGIVHTAVIYGEDDYQLGLKHDLPMVPLLDSAGHFTPDAPELVKGKYFKQSEKLIKADLEERGLMLKKEMHTHSYPHCYRCGTALLYNAITSWFINTQSVNEKMLKTNEDINWYPEHLKHGRYQHILENAPDWTISRNRFWATPLPFWKNPKTGELKVFGSLSELQEYVPKSGNQYFITRHAESEFNVKNTLNDDVNESNGLTEKGEKQIASLVTELKDKKIDLIYFSPLQRTRETAVQIAKALGIDESKVISEERLLEVQFGEFDGKTVEEYHAFFKNGKERLTKRPEGGESWNDVRTRCGELLFDVETTNKNKKILFVSHNGTLQMLQAAAVGDDPDTTGQNIDDDSKDVANAELRVMPFVPYPHNQTYELDLHRPYIDDIELVYTDGTKLERVPEVIDCWAESGSMPFAAFGAPHQNQEEFERSFPADFIAEYIAQTRTWFYYMHTVSVLLFGQASFKNVVTTGNVLAGDGTKMSKSKKNYTDPLANLDEFGADAMRYYLMSSVVMQAEDMSFKDDELKEVRNRIINILFNTYKFFSLYEGEWDKQKRSSKNVLDVWIMARLNQLIGEVTKHMDEYDMTRAHRPFRVFVEDFSTWHVRRSRDRMKGDDAEDMQAALSTMHQVLLTLSKLLAPTMPFIAESVYRGIKGPKESVHLEDWPKTGEVNEKVIEAMSVTREVVSLALEARATAKVKVRQPLQTLKVKTDSAALYEPYVELIKDEVNVKEVVLDPALSTDVWLDVTIDDTLRAEGEIRELQRLVQDMRKKANLQPHDSIILTIETAEAGAALLTEHQDTFKKVVGAHTLLLSPTKGDTVKIGDNEFTVNISTA